MTIQSVKDLNCYNHMELVRIADDAGDANAAVRKMLRENETDGTQNDDSWFEFDDNMDSATQFAVVAPVGELGIKWVAFPVYSADPEFYDVTLFEARDQDGRPVFVIYSRRKGAGTWISIDIVDGAGNPVARFGAGDEDALAILRSFSVAGGRKRYTKSTEVMAILVTAWANIALA